VGVIGGVRKRFDACVGGGAFAIRGLVRFDGRMRTPGAVRGDTPCRPERFLSQSCLSAGLDKRPVSGPPAHDDTHRCPTRGAQGDTRRRGYAPPRRASDGLGVHDHLPEGIGRHGRAGVQKAEVADLHEAIG
jgi:hypothetical protein